MKLEQLDAEKDQSLIIPRALYMTNEESFDADIKKLESIYSRDEILINFKKTKERISNRVCEMVAPLSAPTEFQVKQFVFLFPIQFSKIQCA